MRHHDDMPKRGTNAQELISRSLYIGLCYLVFAGCTLALRKCVQIPTEAFRKLLHCILLGSLLLWTFAFQTWWFAVVTASGFAVIVFLMYAVVTSVCWGWLHDRLLSLCCIYAWGFGNAAALVREPDAARYRPAPAGLIWF